MKKFFLILVIIFLCGIFSADICIERLKDSAVILGKDIYRAYANEAFSFRDVFWDVLYERVKQLVVFVLLCFTPIREKLAVVLTVIFSFMFGFFMMCCIAEMGLAGIVISIASVLPHGLLYGGVIALLLQNKHLRTYRTKDRAIKGIALYVFACLMFLTGCVLESVVGTHFVPWVIRLSQV